MLVELVVDRLAGLEGLGRDTLAGADVGRRAIGLVDHPDPRLRSPELRARARQHGDGELESLRAMHGEDADRVVVGLRKDRFADPARLAGLEIGPQQEVAEPTDAGLGESPRLFEHPSQASPDVARAIGRGGDLEEPELTQNGLDHAADVEVEAPCMDRGEPIERTDDGMVGRQGFGRTGTLMTPTATGLMEREQVVVATRERR